MRTHTQNRVKLYVYINSVKQCSFLTSVSCNVFLIVFPVAVIIVTHALWSLTHPLQTLLWKYT